MKRLKVGLKLAAQLFWAFFRMGPLTFGGGYAMLPAIEEEVVGKRKWMTSEEMGDMVSIAGSAPGGVGINAAAYVGFRVGGFAGAVAAVAGITLPAFIIVFLLSLCYSLNRGNLKLEAALKGIHGAMIALIALAAYKMAKSALFDWPTKIVAAAGLAVLLFTSVHPIVMICAGMLYGVVMIPIKEKLGMNAATEKPSNRPREAMLPEYYI